MLFFYNRYMQFIRIQLAILWAILICTSCSDSESSPAQTDVSNIKNGISFDNPMPEATLPLTIRFRAGAQSALHNYGGSVYLHIGIVEGNNWLYVPAEWNENIEKCRMNSIAPNVWSITLAPDVRTWFGVDEKTIIRKLGIVIRSADGNLKGNDQDFFISLTDSSFTPGETEYAPCPPEYSEGVTLGTDHTSATFVLYDRNLHGEHWDHAYLTGDFNNWQTTASYQMKRDDDRGVWWLTIGGLKPGHEYAYQYFLISKDKGILRLADPYSEKILDPQNDPYISATTYPDNRAYPAGKTNGIVSVLTTSDNNSISKTPFTPPSPDQLIIYEMHLRDFSPTSDLNGAIQHLDYLQQLGINAIELMPVQEFDGNDSWGYNPCFYFALDKAYGTREMYRSFVEACHKRGIAVLFDVVYNHATGNHPFAQLYWDNQNNQTAPENPWFNVKAPHPYSVFHDFNHESELVRTYVKRNLKFLLDTYGIDGFRFDLSKGFTQQSSDENTVSTYDASRIAILKDYYQAAAEANPQVILILEHFCEEREERELAEAGMLLWRNLNYAYCQSAMGYPENSGFGALTTWNTTMPANSWVGYMESHDEERMGYKQTAYSQEPLKSDLKARMQQLALNSAFFLTIPGPKMIWQFGELGYDFSIFSKPDGSLGSESDKTGRKPIRWDYYEQAERQQLYNTYAALLQLRNSYPDLFSQEAFQNWQVSYNDWDNGRYLWMETINGQKLLLIGNFTDTTLQTNTEQQANEGWYDWTDNCQPVRENQTHIAPHSFRLFLNFKP